MKNNYKTINNFCTLDLFNEFKEIVFSENFPWFYRGRLTGDNNKSYWTHCLFNNNKIDSNLFNHNFINFILEKLNSVSLVQIRLNLTLKSLKPVESNFHNDYPYLNCKTAIIYLNTCNGKTVIKKNKEIEIISEENKVLIFDTNILHKAVSQTDVDRRIILNINYFTKK
jgi:hypothetical protein